MVSIFQSPSELAKCFIETGLPNVSSIKHSTHVTCAAVFPSFLNLPRHLDNMRITLADGNTFVGLNHNEIDQILCFPEILAQFFMFAAALRRHSPHFCHFGK